MRALASLYALGASQSPALIMTLGYLKPASRPSSWPRSACGGMLPASVLRLPVMEPMMQHLQPRRRAQLHTLIAFHCTHVSSQGLY